MKIIEFYVPDRYVSKSKYVPLAMRGKIIPFSRKYKIIKTSIYGTCYITAMLPPVVIGH